MNPLRSLPLFKSLDDETFAKLGAIAIRRSFKAGEILFFEGDDPDRLIILTRGVLKLYKTTSGHKEVVLHRFNPVSMIAEAAVLHRVPYPASALFETDGEALLIDYRKFETLFLNDPQLARMLILSLSEKIRALESLIERTLVMDASERVYNLIAKSPELLKKMRHYEVANIMNLTPETFSRTLKKLQHEGKIVRDGALWKVSVDETKPPGTL